jgi:hypothetical protein
MQKKMVVALIVMSKTLELLCSLTRLTPLFYTEFDPMQSSTMQSQSRCSQKLLAVRSKLNNIDLDAVFIFQNNKISDFKYKPSDLNQTVRISPTAAVVVFECTESGSVLHFYITKCIIFYFLLYR